MNEELIKKLLTKFYDGEATEEDEKLLRALFSKVNCPAGSETEWEYVRFCFFNKTVPEPSFNLEDRIERSIDESQNRLGNKKENKHYLIYISGVAAAILLLFGTYFFIDSRNRLIDTYTEPETAYAETMKILLDVSARLNKGTGKLAPVSKLNSITIESLEMINHSSSVINRSLSKIDGVIKTTSLISKSDSGSVKK